MKAKIELIKNVREIALKTHGEEYLKNFAGSEFEGFCILVCNEIYAKKNILLSVKKELGDMWSDGYHCKVDEIEGRKQIKFNESFEKLIKQYEN